MLVMLATNAMSERSFSAHGRSQAQSPHASAWPEGIGRWYDMVKVANMFVGNKQVNQQHKHLFRKFS